MELPQRLCLDLTDTLPRKTHHLTDLLEGLGIGAVETETQPYDPLFFGVQLVQRVAQQVLERILEKDQVGRRDDVLFQLVG